jgi:hypothetical protein
VNGLYWRLAAILAALALLGLYGPLRRLLSRRLYKRSLRAVTAATAATSGGIQTERVQGIISIYRQPAHADRLRAYTVLLDGKAVGEVLPNETCTINAPEGAHVVKVKIDWGESNTLTIGVSPHSPQRLVVKSNIAGLRVVFALWYAVFSPGSYLRLECADT